ncbi:EF-P lysine aminoacylase EpmA [Novipirellula artificiosorum]|uniref:Elongation factor P--(R)-beta-lysine ligase n=1 Tax=Novipirellula artificiosorum TaxID=2528016 RepID=A0A5C6DD06_9BACT|nr:EF-P lysine aminoacylase EpmA [Novipirellula artificiosorum]TWU35123.1 Elongation factor P--(R)-beta-lysine ligase [Novipirellula artificiosorum]
MRANPVPNLERLQDRALLLRQIRSFFDAAGFLEVQPPCLAAGCVVDPYIDPIKVSAKQLGIAEPQLAGDYFLQTSPELSMKRMLAAGAPSIYSVAPVFRAGERGDQHNIEFTMLEWYDVGADLASGIKTLSDFACAVLDYPDCECVTYRDLFRRTLGLDPIECRLERLVEMAACIDDSLAHSFACDRDGLLDLLFTQRIQPMLGIDKPTIVKNYPLSQAALARGCSDDSDCAARFELFARGVELANGYDELLDPEILIERTRISNQRRIASGRAALPENHALLDAMRHGMPPSAGVAVGVDRLLMVKTHANSIASVIPFPIEIA